MYENSYNPTNIDGLITNTYVLAAITAIVFIGISLIVASAIAYEGGKNPRDPKKRRVWFFVLGIIAVIAFFLWNFLFVSGKVLLPALQDKFFMHNAIATGVTLVVYLLIGFLLSKMMKRSKYGTIFS